MLHFNAYNFSGQDYFTKRLTMSRVILDRNQPKKIMQVGIDIKCMYTNFGRCGLSGFGDITTFKNSKISPSDHGP